MKLLLIRHAESEYNIQKTLHLDSGLSELGAEQAAILAQGIVKEFPEIRSWQGYTSPFLRTLQTSNALIEQGVRFRADWRLREAIIDEWTNDEETDIEVPLRVEHYASVYESIEGHPGWRNCRETVSELLERCDSFLTQLKEENGNYVVVSHGLAISTMIDLLNGISQSPRWDGSITNTCVSYFNDGTFDYKIKRFLRPRDF